MAQEYPSIPEEAFIKSGNPVFDLDVLDNMASQVEEGQKGYLWNPYPDMVEFRKDAYSLA